MDNKTSEKSRQKLKRNILFNMILLPIIPFLAVSCIGFYFFFTALSTNTRDSMMRILSDHSRMINSFLLSRKADLALMTRIYSFEDILAPGAIEGIFKNLERRSPAFVDLGLFDEAGRHLCYFGEYSLAGRSYAGEEWFQKTMSGGYFISDIFLGYRNVPHFVIAVRQTSAGHSWVLRATIDTLFFDTLVSGVRMGRTGEAYILNEVGRAQSARRSGDIGLLEEDPAFLWFKELKLGRQGASVTPSGQPFVYAVTKLSDKPWFLVVRQEKQDAYSALSSAAIIGGILTVCGIAVLVVTAVFTTERIIRRLDLLVGEKEALGSQLIRAVQLAEMGEMAAGFAHEINNPLQVIKGEYALLKVLFKEISSALGGREDTLEEIEDSLDQIDCQVARCNKITSAILKFGRKNDREITMLSPSSAIPEILRLVENTARVNGVTLTTRIAPDVPAFKGDASRFQQVMLNLVNNAMDAVTRRHGASGGVIEITAEEKPDEERLEIRVQDNGCGIEPEHMTKIFSPFFTTKAVGRGTGLGLSVCYGIIESFGGTMSVDSRPGDGTVFVIELPAVQSGKGEGRENL